MARARNSKGRFVKSHKSHKSHSGGGGSTALVIRQPAAIQTRTRKVYVPVKSKRRRGGSGGSDHGGKAKAEVGAWGGAIGYLENNNAATYNQIPTFGKLPRTAVIAGVAYFLRNKSKRFDRLATAAIAITGYKLGQQNFALTGDDD